MGAGVARQCSENRCLARWTVWIPHRGRRGGAGRANSKKDLVTAPIRGCRTANPWEAAHFSWEGGRERFVGGSRERSLRPRRAHRVPAAPHFDDRARGGSEDGQRRLGAPTKTSTYPPGGARRQLTAGGRSARRREMRGTRRQRGVRALLRGEADRNDCSCRRA